MGKFNLKQIKTAQNYGNIEKQIDEKRDSMNLSIEKQDVVHKNINLSMTTKQIDNTVPFNLQLDKARKNELLETIIEAQLDNNKNKEEKQITDINLKTQEYDTKKTEEYKKAEDKSKADTEFWDKYIGVQLEENGMPTKVDNNISNAASQIQNKDERFKGKEIDKMVMASLKDADSMIYHIYSIAFSQNRELNDDEKQKIVDINSGKIRLISQRMENFNRSLEYMGDPIIKKNPDGTVNVYEADGTEVDNFKSCEEAKLNYPEAEEQNEEKKKIAQFENNYNEEVELDFIPRKEVRYRATFPIDVFIESTENLQKDQEVVYEIIKQVIEEGFTNIYEEKFKGYKEYLNLSDVQKF